MQGLKIIGILLGIAVAALGWLFFAPDQDLRRIDADIDGHRPAIEQALVDCADLIKEISEYKYTERKKSELFSLRKQYETLDEGLKEILDDDDRDRLERRKALEELEDRYYSLKRDAEDLRARLRGMKEFAIRREEVMAAHGRLVRDLRRWQGESTDPDFQRRANELIDKCNAASGLLEKAMTSMGNSLKDGLTIGTAAMNQLEEYDRGIGELIAEAEKAAGKDDG